MSDYATPKISTVKMGIIGTGNRGSHHAGTISRVSDVEIKNLPAIAVPNHEEGKSCLTSTAAGCYEKA